MQFNGIRTREQGLSPHMEVKPTSISDEERERRILDILKQNGLAGNATEVRGERRLARRFGPASHLLADNIKKSWEVIMGFTKMCGSRVIRPGLEEATQRWRSFIRTVRCQPKSEEPANQAVAEERSTDTRVVLEGEQINSTRKGVFIQNLRNVGVDVLKKYQNLNPHFDRALLEELSGKEMQLGLRLIESIQKMPNLRHDALNNEGVRLAVRVLVQEYIYHKNAGLTTQELKAMGPSLPMIEGLLNRPMKTTQQLDTDVIPLRSEEDQKLRLEWVTGIFRRVAPTALDQYMKRNPQARINMPGKMRLSEKIHAASLISKLHLRKVLCSDLSDKDLELVVRMLLEKYSVFIQTGITDEEIDLLKPCTHYIEKFRTMHA